MGIPTQPNLTTITTEGVKRAGYPSPSASQLTRAEQWVEEVKLDIWNSEFIPEKRLKSLLVTSYGVTSIGKSRYALPSDADTVYSVTILDGDHTGTAQSATASSLVLASDEDITEADALGHLLLITSATAGTGSCSEVTAYNTTTKEATVTPNWGTTPTGTITYMKIDKKTPLVFDDISDKDSMQVTSTGLPNTCYLLGQGNADSDETGEFEFDNPPDAVYGIQLRYFVALPLIDLTSNLMATLYRRWYNVFVEGVFCRQLENDRDARAKSSRTVYDNLIIRLLQREIMTTESITISPQLK